MANIENAYRKGNSQTFRNCFFSLKEKKNDHDDDDDNDDKKKKE